MEQLQKYRGFWDGLKLEYFIDGFNVKDPLISPDGNTVAYIKGDQNGNFLFLYNLIDKTHYQLTSKHPLSTGTAYGGKTYCWDHGSDKLYFSSKGILYYVNVLGGDPIKIHGFDKQFAPVSMENNLFYTVEHEESMSLAIIQNTSNIDKQWPERIPINADFIYDANINSSNGDIAVHAWDFPNMSWNGSKIIIISPQNGSYSNISLKTIAGNDNIATSQPNYSPDGSRICFLSEETGWLNLWIADADGSNKRPLVSESIEHAYSTWVTGNKNHIWLDNNRILFTRNRNGFFTVAEINLNTEEIIDLPLESGFYSHLNSTPNGKYLICQFENYSHRSQIQLINLDKLKNDENDTILIIDQSGIRQDIFNSQYIKPEHIEFQTSDRKSAHGLLYIKEDNRGNKQGAPIIISIHGGPTGMRTNNFNLNAQYFASKGFAFFEVNYRGSIGYGKEYREILNGNWGVYDVNDSIDALDYLEKEGIGNNKSKSIIIGGSAGGFTVLMTLATNPGIFSAGIDFYGVADNFLLAEETHYLESRYTDTLIGPLPEASPKYFKQSPIFMTDQIIDPLIIFQGEDDPVVPKNQSELIKKSVKGPVEYNSYSGEGHGFIKSETYIDVFDKIDKFLKKYVLYNKE